MCLNLHLLLSELRFHSCYLVLSLHYNTAENCSPELLLLLAKHAALQQFHSPSYILSQCSSIAGSQSEPSLLGLATLLFLCYSGLIIIIGFKTSDSLFSSETDRVSSLKARFFLLFWVKEMIRSNKLMGEACLPLSVTCGRIPRVNPTW